MIDHKRIVILRSDNKKSWAVVAEIIGHPDPEYLQAQHLAWNWAKVGRSKKRWFPKPTMNPNDPRNWRHYKTQEWCGV